MFNQFPLNGRLMNGGVLSWTGAGTLQPSSICVDWKNDANPAWTCDFEQLDNNKFIMKDCSDNGKLEC